jgi:hypothetical protein
LIATTNIRLPAPHPGQVAVRQQARRFNWLAAGRRWRKTTLVMAIAIEAAIAGKKVIWGAPVYDQSRVAYDETRKAVAGVATPNISRMTWEFPGGGQIIYRSLDNPDSVRGHTADGVVIDEAADVSPLAWQETLRPMLIDTGGWAWIIGTPKGLNWFAEGHADATTREDSMSWQVPTLGARVSDSLLLRSPHPLENPEIPWDEIVQLFRTSSERSFKQEILAEFLSGDGAVFRNVDACLTAPPTTPDEHRKHITVAGVDWARQHDFTAISIICCTCRQEVHLDRFNQIGWALQRGRLLTALGLWSVKHAVIESNSIGAPNFEALIEHAPPGCGLQAFETTAKSKPTLIQSLALAFERSHLGWLADPVGRHELIAYESTLTDAGHTKYGAPEGGWDDTVIARALAWRAASFRIPIDLTLAQKIQAGLPASWRDDYIRQQDPVTAQRLMDARYDDYEQIKQQLTTVRRPNPYFSDAIDEGSVGDI